MRTLHLTHEGRGLLDQIMEISLEHEQQLCSGLQPAEREQLLTLLNRFAAEQGWPKASIPGPPTSIPTSAEHSSGPETRLPASVISPFLRGHFVVDHTQYDSWRTYAAGRCAAPTCWSPSTRSAPPTSRKGADVTGAPPAGVPSPTVTPLAQRSRRLPRRWRNLLLITHIVVWELLRPAVAFGVDWLLWGAGESASTGVVPAGGPG